MNIQTTNTAPKPDTFKRYPLDSTLPHMVRRVHNAEFKSQDDIASAYGIDKGTASRWKRRAMNMGLIDSRSWRYGLLLGQLRSEFAA